MKSKNTSKPKLPKKNKETKTEKSINKEKIPQKIDSLSLLDSSIKEILNQLGYESLTNVQNKMIQEILNNNNNQNIICKSTKGSGKMLSFLLPIIHKILENEKKEKIERYIIITGIKERALEIYSMSKELLKDLDGKKVAVCTGGSNRKKECVKLMEKNVKLIISTPQRIVEYMKNDKGKKLILNNDISTIIFDKVENMEKNGYIKELKEIVDIFGFNYMKIAKKEQKKSINENINFIFYCQYEEYENDDGEDEDNNKIQSDIRELIESSERKYNTIIIKENIKKNENSKNKISKPIISKRGYIILDPSKKFLFLLTFLRKNIFRNNKRNNFLQFSFKFISYTNRYYFFKFNQKFKNKSNNIK